MNINELEAEADKSLNYLAKTDVPHAQLKALQNLLSEHRKHVIAVGFQNSKASSAEGKRQDAHATPEYLEHLKKMEETDVKFITMDNRRKTAVATMDMYRTCSANQRKG